jgi:hypothetical protein
MMYVLFTYIVDDCNERGGVYNLLRTHWIRSSLSTMTTFHSLLSRFVRTPLAVWIRGDTLATVTVSTALVHSWNVVNSTAVYALFDTQL